MTPTEARSILSSLDLTQSDLARRVQELGDTRPFPSVLRGVQRALAGDERGQISWQMAFVLRVIKNTRDMS